MIYYIADTHFGHENVIKNDERPFADAEEMDSALIENWNAKVKSDDTVYVVGDFAYRPKRDLTYYLERLNGHKHLIIGNHDRIILKSPAACEYFESMEKRLYIRDGDRIVILSHFPMAEWNGMERGSYHVFGHIHTKTDETYRFMYARERAFNAGCMVNNYAPATLDELAENKQKFHLYHRL